MSEVSVSRVRSGSPNSAALCRLAFELAALSGWRRSGLSFLLGLVAVAALPPVDMTPLLGVAFTGLLWLEEGSSGPRASFGLGYAFGFGFFLGGLYWIAGALFVDFARFWWLIPIAAVGLPAIFAVYTGLVLFAVNLASRCLSLQLTPRIFAFAVAWTGAEWVRGHAFTGFPWNLIGSTWAGGFPGGIAILQTVAWVGIYGLSFATVLTA
ncbi:MAG: apolipoprotein N-acyltransferase, partial [Alphaproteobacteria bacterium]|nr:apolipoprotein N-acyltransferase [Alphaproteobacteria bacterium]